jgi:hypothetical protein
MTLKIALIAFTVTTTSLVTEKRRKRKPRNSSSVDCLRMNLKWAIFTQQTKTN